MIKLSICIATLNRAAFIGLTLESILAQMSEDIEIVVVDGASTDETDIVVSGLFADRTHCHYHRLVEKGGVDLDYCRAVEMATGEFCWLMTDDDLLKPGALSVVLKHLSEDLDLLIVNSEVANRDMSRTLVPKRLRCSGDISFQPEDSDDLLAITGDLLSFIGSVVMRRSTWLERDIGPYLGSEFIHVGIIFQRPLNRTALVLADPLIRIRYGNAQWSSRAFDVWMFKWPSLIWSFRHLSAEAKNKVISSEPYQHFTHLIAMKARGCFQWRDYNCLATRRLGFGRRACAAALAAFPEKPFNALASLIYLLLAPRMKWDPLICEDLKTSPYHYQLRRLKTMAEKPAQGFH